MAEQQPTPEPTERPTVIPPETAAAYGRSVNNFFAHELTTLDDQIQQIGTTDETPLLTRAFRRMPDMIASFSSAETVTVRKLPGGEDERGDYEAGFSGERPPVTPHVERIDIPSDLVAKLATAIEDRFANASGTIGLVAQDTNNTNLQTAVTAIRIQLEAFKALASISVITDNAGNDEFIFTKAEETT